MRKFFQILGIVTAIVVVVGGIGVFFLVRNGRALDAESKAYVDDALVSNTQHWSSEELLRRMTPRAREVSAPDKVRQLLDGARTNFGALVEYGGAHGDAMMFVSTGAGATISARYVAKAKFENGEANFHMTLRKLEGAW